MLARLAKANLVTKTNVDTKLISLNKKIHSNKTKHVIVENELKKLQTFDSSYFWGKSKIRVKFNGSCLKQDKVTYTHGKLVNIYIVYETGIKILIGHQKLSNKNVICLALMYQNRTFCPALLSLSIMCGKSFSISYSIL